MIKKYEEAIERMGKQLSAIRWSVEVSGDDGREEYAELRGEVKAVAFLMGIDEKDIYRDVKEAAAR